MNEANKVFLAIGAKERLSLNRDVKKEYDSQYPSCP